MPTRREFLNASALGVSAAAQTVFSQPAQSAPAHSGKKVRLAVVGGGFGASFYWHEHPNCIVTAVTDLYAARRQRLRDAYRCDSVYDSMEDMLKKRNDIDAVAIFSGAPDHPKHVEMCFERGLHVVSAVPACNTLEQASRLKELKEKTRVKYMMAESSYYYSGCIYARELYRNGGFGDLFYTEMEYYHDSNLEQALKDRRSLNYNPDGSNSWRQALPPMLYPTHSVAFVVGVTGERIQSVSCLGWGNPRLVSQFKTNAYHNPFSNETALMRTNRGNMTRCNVFWQIAAKEGVRARWFGEKGSLYMADEGIHGDIWQRRYGSAEPIQFPDYWKRDSVPPPMRHASGHSGSAVLICAEFINALLENREPEVDLYESLAMTVPGIVAHQSALKNGEQLRVPGFEKPA